MASRENMEKKLVLLEQRLKGYGYVPSQKEDRPLYANTKYYYTNYPSHPIVKRLMEEFPFETSRSRHSMSREESILYLQNELEQRGKNTWAYGGQGFIFKNKVLLRKLF